jgi:hypothetical protein
MSAKPKIDKKPKKQRHTHQHEVEASIVWTPAKAYEDDYVNPDWLVGAN